MILDPSTGRAEASARGIRTRPRDPAGIRTARVLLAAAVLACATPRAPLAHEYWLSVSRYTAAPREAILIGGVAGTGFRGERKPYSPPRCVRFIARTSRDLDLSRVGRIGDVQWARFAPTDGGGAMFAYESDFARIELPAAEFDRYLENEGLDQPLAERRRSGAGAPGRERYRRCSKAWLSGTDAPRATRPIGLPLEVVPLSTPGAAVTLRVRVNFEGRPLAGALVKAWRTGLDPGGATREPATRDSVDVAWRGRTDARGEVEVPIAGPGEWLLSAVHMVSSHDRSAADWESSWASLTFAVPPPARSAR
jgi:hypothetical protein